MTHPACAWATVRTVYPNRCVYRQVNDYLRTGELPARNTVCDKDPGNDTR